MATFTKKNWVTGEIITDTKLNNEKGYYLLEVEDLNEALSGFELQVGTLTEDDLLNIIYQNNNYYNRVTSWNYNMIDNKYINDMIGNGIEYYPSTGILKAVDSGDGPIG